ncbi:MAG TPA: exosortase/archaeosortase family protein [Candidatus Binatus sp.]|nr:exosortase/archaeosortase family protein [Candidatus Binatus sp.]
MASPIEQNLVVGEQLPTSFTIRNISFLLLISATFVWFWQTLEFVLTLSIQGGRFGHYSHIVLIPFLSIYLLYLGRKEIFSNVESSPWLGSFVTGVGVVLVWNTSTAPVDPLDGLSHTMLSMVVLCWGAFLLHFGAKAFRKAYFGLLFMLFMVPLPSLLLDNIIGFLQGATAEGVDFMFGALRIPVFRQNEVFALSNLTIQIAEECSGIRSSIALFISSLVAGHLFLGSTWTKLVLVTVVIPLTIIKNIFRIVVLSLLANYIDPSFLTDSILHHSGGIPLFFVAGAVLLGILWLLRRCEKSPRQTVF